MRAKRPATPTEEAPSNESATGNRSQLRSKRAEAGAPPSERPSATEKMSRPICLAHSRRRWASSGGFGRRRLLAGALLCTLAALLVAPQLQPNNFRSVAGLKALKALAKTFVYQQLTQRKNFVPLPVPIPVPIEINEPPVYLKGKPKYVNVYKPKPTAAPAAKPTTVYHMPIYSPTYEYMSMEPMSSMYGHVAPMVYAGPYGKTGLPGAGYKSASASDEPEASGYANGAGSPAAMINFNDYDDESGHYYLGRSGRRHSKLVAATAGDYISGASLYLNQRKDEPNKYEDAAAAGSQHQEDLATSSSSSANSLAPPANGDKAHRFQEADREEEEEEEEERHSAGASSSAVSPQMDNSMSAPAEREAEAETEAEADVDDEQDSSSGQRAALRRSKRQLSYQSGYDGEENCHGFPLEVNVRSRVKLDRIFPIFGSSQIRKCVKPKKPFHILPPP